MPTPADVQRARERISDAVVRTPVVPALALRDRLPGPLFIKLESLQRTGSFKDRGALNRLLALTADERARGVVTASAGNHAQAVAYHGARLGIPVQVVMPEHTPLIKVANTHRFGADVRFHGATLDEAITEARRLEAEEAHVLVHAFDDERVIAGQGTVGLEMLEQLPNLTAVVVPIGGGGLISGIAIAIKEQRPSVKIFGVEAAAAPSALASRRAGHLVKLESADTLADGIAVKRVGERTFPLIERYVDDIVSVDEAAIAAAIHLLLEYEKVLAEGAGAVRSPRSLPASCPSDPATSPQWYSPAETSTSIWSSGSSLADSWPTAVSRCSRRRSPTARAISPDSPRSSLPAGPTCSSCRTPVRSPISPCATSKS